MREARPRAALLCALALGALGHPSMGSAQGVTGRVREEATGAPLPGVLVSMIGDDGGRVGAVLSDSVGRFVIRAGRAAQRARLKAERIGMATTVTDWLSLEGGRLLQRDLSMRTVAVELEGLVVGAPVQRCQVDPVEGPRIQRWWDEARKALDVTSVVQARSLARFRIFRFEREWSADLRSLVREEGRRSTAWATRPFASLDADALERGGYVQGSPGARVYHAPDAEVLLSSGFLSTHCFALSPDGEGRPWLGLKFAPTRARKAADISGTFWVDTLTSELKALDFRYVNLPDDLPGDQAGGRLEFRYLASGAWIVPQWWIRVPRVGMRTERVRGVSTDAAELVGYVDTGGRAEQVTTRANVLDRAAGWGRIEGSVFDSLVMGPLEGARVQVSGTRWSALAGRDGRFTLDSVPEGTHSVTFFRDDLTTALWPSPVAEVAVRAGETSHVTLSVPPFRAFAGAVCPGSAGRDAQAILALRVRSHTDEPMERALVQVRWQVGDPSAGLAREARSEAYTGTLGSAVFCEVPAETEAQVRVKAGDRWMELLTLTLPSREVTAREAGVGRSPGGVRR